MASSGIEEGEVCNVQRIVCTANGQPRKMELDIERVVLLLSKFNGKPNLAIRYMDEANKPSQLIVVTPSMIQTFPPNTRYGSPSLGLLIPDEPTEEHTDFLQMVRLLQHRLVREFTRICVANPWLVKTMPALQSVNDEGQFLSLVNQIIQALIYPNKHNKAALRVGVKVLDPPAGTFTNPLVTKINRCAPNTWEPKADVVLMQDVGAQNNVRALLRLDGLYFESGTGFWWVRKSTLHVMLSPTSEEEEPAFVNLGSLY